MEITSVNCNNCGAPLEVAPKTNFVTCRHCGSHLAIKRTASTAYTEMLDELDRKTDAIADRVEILIRQNELERIDREWEEERQRYMTTGKHGTKHVPTRATAYGMMVFGVIMALMFVVPVLGSNKAPGGIACFGFIVIAVAVGIGLYTLEKARQYEEAEARYRQRRAAAANRPLTEAEPAARTDPPAP